MQTIHFSGIPVRNPLTERATSTVDLSRVNTLLNPLGQTSCRGWFLLLKSHMDSLDLNALHTVTYNDDRWGSVTARNLAVCREPVKVHYTFSTGQSLSCYLVEVTDRRGQLHNSHYFHAVNKIYNVRAPGWGGAYYADSTNGGTAWTWAEMAQDLWETMPILGAWPGLPVSPSSTPEHWIFQGVSAWESLCAILAQLGCAVSCDLTLASNQYSIVDIGVADATMDDYLNTLDDTDRKLHDAEFQTVVRGRVPYGVRVFFHSIRQHFGTEETTPKTSSQWLTGSVYTVDVTGPDSANAESGLYMPIWSDLPAIYDVSGSLTNSSALNTEAQNQSDNFFARIRGDGGKRLHRIYDGAANIHPTGTIKGVSWKQNPLPLAEEGGIVTEIIRHPLAMLAIDPAGCFCECDEEDSTALHPPDFRQTVPNYPGDNTIIELSSGTPSGSLYDATVEILTTAPNTFADKEAIKAVDLDGATSLTSGTRHLGRLSQYDGTSKPIFVFRSGTTAAGNLNWSNITITSTGSTFNFDTNTTLNFTGSEIYLDSGSIIQVYYITTVETTTPSTPASGTGRIYEKADGKLYFINDDGTEYDLTAGASGTDELVKVSANDTTAGYLNGKAVEGNEIVFTENNDGSNETLTIALTAFSGARVYHATSQTVTSGSTSALALNTERYDTDTFHDTSTNNSRLTIGTAGKYHFGAYLEAGTSTVGTSGTWKAVIRLNGTTTIAVASQTYKDISTTMFASVSGDWDCSASDYVEVVLTNNCNNTLTVGGVESWCHKIK